MSFDTIAILKENELLRAEIIRLRAELAASNANHRSMAKAMTDREQLVENMARASRKQRFERTRRIGCLDETLPPTEEELGNASAALSVVIDDVLVEVRKEEPLEDWAVKRPRTAAEIEAALIERYGSGKSYDRPK